MRRVVVTGIGLVTPLGTGVNTSWSNILASKSGISKITRFDTSDLTCKIAGQVKEGEAVGEFNPVNYIPAKDIKKMDRFIHFGMAAAIEAVEDSGWMPEDQHDRDMTGVMIGSGIGGLPSVEETSIILKEQGARRISPFFIPSILINLCSGHVSIKYGFSGPNHSVVTACATSAHAIGDAMRIIQMGDADVMVAGGAEGAMCRISVAGFAAARALTTGYNDTPELASRPWDKDRDGFVLSEGAGVLVLEELEHAKKRGAKIYGELIGYGLTGDAYHITSPHPEGRGGYRAMEMALRKAQINPEQIDYINAHGTSTPAGDSQELRSVYRLVGENNKVSMSSTKSSIGHLLGAAGAVETIFCLLAMRDNILPPTLNLENPDVADCNIDLVPKIAKEKKIDIVMSNSFGFGGTNACLLAKRFVK